MCIIIEAIIGAYVFLSSTQSKRSITVMTHPNVRFIAHMSMDLSGRRFILNNKINHAVEIKPAKITSRCLLSALYPGWSFKRCSDSSRGIPKYEAEK
jgi:hypothetical protein